MLLDQSIPLWLNIFVIIANILNLFYNIPQMYKTYQRKSTRDISGWFLILRNLSAFIWLFYSLYINNVQLVIANGVTILANSFIIYYKIFELLDDYYKKEQTTDKDNLEYDANDLEQQISSDETEI